MKMTPKIRMIWRKKIKSNDKGNLQNKDDLQNEDDLQIKDDLKNEDNLLPCLEVAYNFFGQTKRKEQTDKATCWRCLTTYMD